MRLDPVVIDHSTTIENLLSFYMGKNTPDRQQFIIENLKVELDLLSDNSDEWYNMAIDEAAVRNIAKLARIKVPEDEVSTLAEELSRIIRVKSDH